MSSILKNCTSAILAGGENIRLPVSKAFIEVDGVKIIERSLKVMKNLFKEVFIITNQPEAYVYLGVPLFGDIYNIQSPMTGIFTSLLNSSNQWVFISACDMPFINAHLITYMASKRNNFDAVVPILKSKIEPLFAFYSKQLLASMEKAILTDKRGLQNFLNNKRIQHIETKEIKKIDLGAKSFINLNTPEDIDYYLQPKDKIKFKRKAGRRGKCLVLE